MEKIRRAHGLGIFFWTTEWAYVSVLHYYKSLLLFWAMTGLVFCRLWMRTREEFGQKPESEFGWTALNTE